MSPRKEIRWPGNIPLKIESSWATIILLGCIPSSWCRILLHISIGNPKGSGVFPCGTPSRFFDWWPHHLKIFRRSHAPRSARWFSFLCWPSSSHVRNPQQDLFSIWNGSTSTKSEVPTECSLCRDHRFIVLEKRFDNEITLLARTTHGIMWK